MKVSEIMDVEPTLAFLARPYVWVEATKEDTEIINGLEKAGGEWLNAITPILAEKFKLTFPFSIKELGPFSDIEVSEVNEHFNILKKKVEKIGLELRL